MAVAAADELVVLVVRVDGDEVLDLLVEEDELDELWDPPLVVYTDSRLPAPQSCVNELPGQGKLQSPAGAGMDPGLKLLPQ